jgi:HD-GYP domain-containing protein (c-di-GMP phosphodiesterase class II)
MKNSIDHIKTQISRLIEIGIALSAELNLNALLEKIVYYARELTHADGGTLYLFQDNKLHFKILQNETLGIFKGGKTGEDINLPPVPLQESNVSAYAALTRSIVNIDDVYESKEFDFTGPREYDAKTGYRSRSMLVVPMEDHEGELIGVLQLMNAIDPQSRVVTRFSNAVVDITRAFASQAAVAISNAHLIQETKALFESLVQVLAVAVDAKSPYTGNHIQRVAELTVWLARAINDAKSGPFADVHFSEEEMEEIRLSGWLHDVGKVTTPVWVMDKATKLESLFDRIELIKTRFDLIKATLKAEALQRKIHLLQKQRSPNDFPQIEHELELRLRELDDEKEFLAQCNQPGEFMDEDRLNRLECIAKKRFTHDGIERPYLTEDELDSLSVRKGSLTRKEIDTMRDHVRWTKRMLEEVPFRRHLKNVPLFAGQHHEKMNGSGYPSGLKAKDLPLQSRLLAISDFYEALSAKDRPYKKKKMSTNQILTILRSAADRGEIDKDILELMIKEKVYEKFEESYDASQKTKH